MGLSRDSRPSTVLQVHTHYRRPGGEDAVVSNLTSALSRAGIHTETFETENPSGMATVAGLSRAVWNKKQAGALTRHIESLKPDVTHIHNTWFAMSASVAETAHRAGPVVMTLHNYRLTCANGTLYRAGGACEKCVDASPWTGMWLNCYRDPISSGIAAANVAIHRKRNTWNDNVDSFFALSAFAVEIFVRGGIERERLQVIDNHVADPGPRPAPPSESDYVLYVGRLSEEKGVAGLVERWSRVGPDDLDLVVCGDGPLRSQLQSTPGVILKGWTAPDEVARLMLNARALIFPSSWYEGQPLTILEAFASGLPVLGSRIGAITELLEFLGPEWLPRPDSDDDWGRGFELLTTSAVDQASRKVRSRFMQRHTESVVVDRLIEGYRRAIADHAS